MLQQPTWFSEDQYYADKLAHLKAMGYTQFSTVAQVKDAIDGAYGSAWQHYNLYGYKETYLENGVTKYIGLKDASGKLVFDPQIYCESKLASLNAEGSEYKGQFSNWEDVAKAISSAGMNLYEHYYSFGQMEGMALNATFDSGKFFNAKLAYLQADHEKWGIWDMDKLKEFFTHNGWDAYSNWVAYGASEGITEAMISYTSDIGGEVFYLTTGADNLTGTNGNDMFVAYAYGNENSLNTGDRINGGAGNADTLFADLVGTEIALMPIVNNVEIIKFQVQHEGVSGGVSNNVNGYIDAQRISGSYGADGNMQIWSVDSRDDLVIEDVRVLSTKMIVGMQNTDPGAIDYEFYFDGQHIVSKETKTDGNLYLELIDSQGALKGSPLLENAYDTVKFHYNNEYYSVNFGTVDGADADYQDIVDAINAKLTEMGLNITAKLGSTFTQYDGLSGQPVTGTQIVLEGSGTFSITNTTGEERDGWEASKGLNPDNSLSATMTQETSTDCPLLQTNVALDNVARVVWTDPSEVCLPDTSVYGSTAGNLIIGSMATRGGVQRFDVTVDRGSWLNSMASTNNDLRMITVDDKDWNGDGTEDGGPLFIGAHPDNHTVAGGGSSHGVGSNIVSWQGAPRFLSHTGTNMEYPNNGVPASLGDDVAGIWDVKYFDSTSYSGNVNIAAQFSEESYKKYLDDVDGLRTVYDNYAPNGDFQYNFGAGNDTLNMLVNGGIAADRDFKLVMNMGAGDDWVNFKFDFNTVNQCINQTNLENVSIVTGAGIDYVWTWGEQATVNVVDKINDAYTGVYGYTNIDMGSGDDVLYAAQDAGADANSVWVLNASGSHANSDIFGIKHSDVQGAQPADNNVGSVNNNWTVIGNGGLAINTTYAFDVEVTFLGISARVTVETKTVGATATGGWNVSSEAINNAIIGLIKNHSVLSKLLSVSDGAGNSLLVQSLINGEYVLGDDFNVNFWLKTGAGAYVSRDQWFEGFTHEAHDASGTPTLTGVSFYDIGAIAAGTTYTLDFGGATYTYTAAAGDSLASVLAQMNDAGTLLSTVLDITVNSDGKGFSLINADHATALVVANITNLTGWATTLKANTFTYDADVIGADEHFYGLSLVNGGDGNDVLVTGHADAIVFGGAGNDTIIVGNLTFNEITGGTEADYIYLGLGDNGLKANAAEALAYDIVHQGIKDSGTMANSLINTTNSVVNVSGFDVIANFDADTANIIGDRLNISSYKSTATNNANFAAGPFTKMTAANAIIEATGLGVGVNNSVKWVSGTYDQDTGNFTLADGGADMLLAYDSDSSDAISWEAVVIIGRGQSTDVRAQDVDSTTNSDYLFITAP